MTEWCASYTYTQIVWLPYYQLNSCTICNNVKHNIIATILGISNAGTHIICNGATFRCYFNHGIFINTNTRGSIITRNIPVF